MDWEFFAFKEPFSMPIPTPNFGFQIYSREMLWDVDFV
jgi:hypothetical protein